MELLKLDGDIYAFQKQLASEAGTIRLIAEFSNVNEAANSVERVNGRTVRVGNSRMVVTLTDMLS
jgi:hypothetical protein